jgi:adenosine deaminase
MDFMNKSCIKMNEIQKLIIEDYLLERTFLSDDDYDTFYNDFNDDSLKDDVEHYKEEIQRLKTKYKRILNELERW